jgi:5-hydroxyisourate hydrolase-like protein (transthyretin family)
MKTQLSSSLPIFITCLSLVSSLIFSSCTHGPYTPKSDPQKAEARGLPIVFLDKDLRRTLSVDVPVTTATTPAGNLEIQVPFRNRTNNEVLHLQIQTLFRNSAGRVLYSEPGSEPAWTTINLSPNQSAYYKQSALSKEATAFTIRVRYQDQSR